MTAENKKLLWLGIAGVALVLVLAVAALFLFAPLNTTTAKAPATIGNTAAPKAADPQDFLSLPPQTLPTEGTANKDGDVIVIYGDKPATLSPTLPGSAAPTGAATATSQVSPDGSTATATATVSSSPAALPPAAAPATVAVKPAASKPAASRPAAAKTTAKPAVAAHKSTDEYWIQAASFTSRGKADELKEGLAKKGMAALIMVKDISGKSWYRVRIGPYSNSAEATGWLGRVKGVPGCEEATVWKSPGK
jgi:DedD protein